MALTVAPLRAKAASQPAIDRDAFLRAVAEVETGGNARAVGRKGERGMYQFSRTTWRQHTRQSFMNAHNPSISYTVAVKHFDWLYDGFVRNGRQPDTFAMAAAWNGGLSRTLSGRIVKATRNYATRVANLTVLYQAPRALVAAAPVAPPRAVAAAPTPAAHRTPAPVLNFLPPAAPEAPPILALQQDDDSIIAFSLAPPVDATAPAETRPATGQLFFFATLGD